MTKVQKVIIIVYLVLLVLVCVYVPWRVGVRRNDSEGALSLGYAPLWSSPTDLKDSFKISFSTIDYGKITLELIALTAIFGVLFVLTLGPKKD